MQSEKHTPRANLSIVYFIMLLVFIKGIYWISQNKTDGYYVAAVAFMVVVFISILKIIRIGYDEKIKQTQEAKRQLSVIQNKLEANIKQNAEVEKKLADNIKQNAKIEEELLAYRKDISHKQKELRIVNQELRNTKKELNQKNNQIKILQIKPKEVRKRRFPTDEKLLEMHAQGIKFTEAYNLLAHEYEDAIIEKEKAAFKDNWTKEYEDSRRKKLREGTKKRITQTLKRNNSK